MRYVLIVDDDPIARETLAAALGLGGDAVSIARDGEEAVALVRAMRFDVVLSDVQMEPLDGLGAAKAIRSFAPRLPIVFMTGHPTADVLRRALDLGAYTVAPKTLGPAGVLRLVHSAASEAIVLVVGADEEAAGELLEIVGAGSVPARFATDLEALEILMDGVKVDVCILTNGARRSAALRHEIADRSIPCVEAPLAQATSDADYAHALLERVGRARLDHARP